MFRFSFLDIHWKWSFNLFVDNSGELCMAFVVLLISFFLTDKNTSIWLTEQLYSDVYDLLKFFIGYSVGCLYSRRSAFFDERKLTSAMVRNSNLSKFDKINATIYANSVGTSPGVYFIYWEALESIGNTPDGRFDRGWGRRFKTKDYQFSLLRTVEAAERYIADHKEDLQRRRRQETQRRRSRSRGKN